MDYDLKFNESNAKDMQLNRDLEVTITNIPIPILHAEDMSDGGAIECPEGICRSMEDRVHIWRSEIQTEGRYCVLRIP